MPNFEDHDCHLLRPEEEIVKNFIATGFLIPFRRTLRSWCMISRSHPETRRYFKSHTACRDEEIRHLVSSYYMIHPFSKLNLYWEFYMSCLFFITYMLIAIDSSIVFLRKEDKLYLTKLIFDMFHIMDICKLFFTGYYDEKRSRVILNFYKVAKNYLFTYFFFDVVSCTCSLVYLLRFVIEMSYTVVFPLRIFNRIKIARLPRCLTALELFRQYTRSSSYLFKGIRVVFIFTAVSLWAFSIHFFVTHCISIFITENVEYVEESIFENFYEATSMFLWVSYGKYRVMDALEYINAIYFLFFGFMLQMFIYSQLLQVWIKYQSAENKQIFLYQQFEEYVKYQNLPVDLRRKFFSYFNFKFHNDFYTESDVDDMISPFMKQEILMHITRDHIGKVDFFRYIPEKVLTQIVIHLKPEVFLPGDVIVSAGRSGTNMYFIYRGTVAVYTPKGKEICHLEDGSHFGEIALVLREARVASVVAVTPSELFVLKRPDFFAAIENYPEIENQLQEMATKRLYEALAQKQDV